MHRSDSTQNDELIRAFEALYPSPGSELVFHNAYQLLVSVILSAQCTDKKVNEITPILFTKFANFKELSSARLSTIEKIIRPINYYKTKSKNLKAMATKVIEDFGGEIPQTHESITTLPGVGNKTANVVLGELKVAHTLPVDTHVFRVSKRLSLTKGKNVVEVEKDLKSKFPSHLWRNLHHWLILHGRRVCKAQRPLCNECTLISLCPTGKELKRVK
jgi:endonuclease-3